MSKNKKASESWVARSGRVDPSDGKNKAVLEKYAKDAAHIDLKVAADIMRMVGKKVDQIVESRVSFEVVEKYHADKSLRDFYEQDKSIFRSLYNAKFAGANKSEDALKAEISATLKKHISFNFPQGTEAQINASESKLDAYLRFVDLQIENGAQLRRGQINEMGEGVYLNDLLKNHKKVMIN